MHANKKNEPTNLLHKNIRKLQKNTFEMEGIEPNQNIYDNTAFYENYIALRKQSNGLNNALENPHFKKLLPEVKEKDILDLGCGFGKASYEYIQGGAKKVVAVDISDNMVQHARENYAAPNLSYCISPIQEYDYPENAFDVVVSSLCFHDIEDYKTLIQNIKRTLRTGGVLLFSQEHPYTLANIEKTSWQQDANGDKKHWIVDNYHEEGARRHDWFVEDVLKYHRTLENIINTLIKHGFLIDHLGEPFALPAFEKDAPELKDERRRPPFLFVRCRKP